jgi:hypothetical protein
MFFYLDSDNNCSAHLYMHPNSPKESRKTLFPFKRQRYVDKVDN